MARCVVFALEFIKRSFALASFRKPVIPFACMCNIHITQPGGGTTRGFPVLFTFVGTRGPESYNTNS